MGKQKKVSIISTKAKLSRLEKSFTIARDRFIDRKTQICLQHTYEVLKVKPMIVYEVRSKNVWQAFSKQRFLVVGLETEQRGTEVIIWAVSIPLFKKQNPNNRISIPVKLRVYGTAAFPSLETQKQLSFNVNAELKLIRSKDQKHALQDLKSF